MGVVAIASIGLSGEATTLDCTKYYNKNVVCKGFNCRWALASASSGAPMSILHKPLTS